MSVAVALKENDIVFVGVDNRVSGEHIYHDVNEKPLKAVVLENGIILAFAGNPGLFSYYIEEMEKLEDIDEDSIRNKAVYKVKEIINNQKLCYEDRQHELIIAYKDKAYTLNDLGYLEEIFNMRAIGSGEEAALGSLFTSVGANMSAEDKVIKAIQCAGDVVNSVSKTGWLINTKDKVFKQF